MTALAERLALGPAVARRRIKRLLRTAANASLGEQLDRERDAMAEAVAGNEAREGIDAFLAERVPDFTRGREGR